MKNNFFLILIAGILISCSNDETTKDENNSCRLESVNLVTLTFDDLTFLGLNTNSQAKMNFEYDDQNRISKVKGSFISVPIANQLNNWVFSADAFDLVTYNNNSVKVEYAYNNTSPYTKEFTIENDRLISRKVTKLYPFKLETVIYNYEYVGNEIREVVNDYVTRIFTVVNGNLTKVEEVKYLTATEFIKIDHIFSGYDNSPNFLKGKFFVNGAFFKAFSKNNYSELKINTYRYKDDIGTLIDESGKSFQLNYNSNNIANIFETECN